MRVPAPLAAAAPAPLAVAAAQPEPAAPEAMLAFTRAIERLANRKQPDVHVHVAPPQVTVHVPEQRAPDVHVTVEQPQPRAVRVEVDGDGVKRFIPEDA